jgi:hypothetical protein
MARNQVVSASLVLATIVQRKLGAGDNSSRREKCLVAAPTALIQTASLDETMLVTLARGADETNRPTPPLQHRPVQLLRSIKALEFACSETLLELHFVARHGTTPSMFLPCSRARKRTSGRVLRTTCEQAATEDYAD